MTQPVQTSCRACSTSIRSCAYPTAGGVAAGEIVEGATRSASRARRASSTSCCVCASGSSISSSRRTRVVLAHRTRLRPLRPAVPSLVVEHRPSRRLIGTYRIQTTEMAQAADGFYTGSEFDLSALPAEILAHGVEVGAPASSRAPLRPVLFCSGKGLPLHGAQPPALAVRPCSLTSRDPWDGKRALDQLARRELVRHDVVVARSPIRMRVERREPARNAPRRSSCRPVEIYLRSATGRRPAGPRREFGTVDFFVLFDVEALTPRARRLFFG